jgi:hypothetical protein
VRMKTTLGTSEDLLGEELKVKKAVIEKRNQNLEYLAERAEKVIFRSLTETYSRI